MFPRFRRRVKARSARWNGFSRASLPERVKPLLLLPVDALRAKKRAWESSRDE